MKRRKQPPSAQPITSQALMRCLLLCQTLRSSCDKALSWVNNEWNKPISSKFNCIFCFLNMKEDRSSRSNEPFSTLEPKLALQFSAGKPCEEHVAAKTPGFCVFFPNVPDSLCMLQMAPAQGNTGRCMWEHWWRHQLAHLQDIGRQERSGVQKHEHLTRKVLCSNPESLN